MISLWGNMQHGEYIGIILTTLEHLAKPKEDNKGTHGKKLYHWELFFGNIVTKQNPQPKKIFKFSLCIHWEKAKNWAILVLIPIHLEKSIFIIVFNTTIFIIVFNTLFAQSNAKSLIRSTYWRSQSLNKVDGLFFVVIDNQHANHTNMICFQNFPQLQSSNHVQYMRKQNKYFCNEHSLFNIHNKIIFIWKQWKMFKC